MPFWYCLTHRAVETDSGCAHAERLGPYEEREAAEAALERARENADAWDNDPRWNDDD